MVNELIIKKIAEELGIRTSQVDAVVKLIDEGCTIPFIARYRKEATGALDDETLRKLDEKLKYLINLEERKETVLASIEEQGKLTDELRQRIVNAETAAAVEDLYRPYKPKRKTRADIAREKGLAGLAEFMLSDAGGRLMDEALKYISEEKEVGDAETAIKLAQDIIAGDISDNADYRAWIRNRTFRQGELVSSRGAGAKKAEEAGERTVYENYYDYREAVSRIPGHRVLAINRGEKEKVLSVSIDAPVDGILDYLERKTLRRVTDECESYVIEAVEDGYKRLIAPSIETEIRGNLTEAAEEGAIKVFGSNLEQLLMQPPLRNKTVLGWDPAFRTGCKLAVCDPTGKILDTAVIYPTAPQNKIAEAEKKLKELCDKYDIDVISVGNGTASRESEKIIADFIKKYNKKGYKTQKTGIAEACAGDSPVAAEMLKTDNKVETAKPGNAAKLQYVIVNEAGASVYSASKLATREYPNLDVGERSSASIARRLQDPLAELVKIDPKAIGVGQYQHDMNQKRLGEALGAVVETCVNRVGVDVNTASPSLLEYVSGISAQIAANIVKYRDENGRYESRKDLLKVPKLGPKAFEQCAGFLRISGGSEPLDSTAVHPESYDAAKAILNECGYDESDVIGGRISGDRIRKTIGKSGRLSGVLSSLGIGEFTFADIVSELEKPGRDPRDEAPAPVLRSDVMELSDLRPEMVLKGTVRNIVDFGAFVDIGVHQDGLVHISQMSDKFVKHPLDVVKVGDVVDVRVLSVDGKRGKIALSMI